ncbi:MAG: YdcH family protein [Alphaproteobacteria bacterium]
MEAEARLVALTSKHTELEEAIDDENHRPLPDSLRILRLKRQKLRIKDEIARLQHA